MINKAIEKINKEMQKNSSDRYTEVIGHYVIDRCTDDITAAKVMDEKKSLKGAMNAIMSLAQKAKQGHVAVLLPDVVFGAVDKYFGFSLNEQAQESAVSVACAATGTPVTPPVAKKVALNLSDFL